MRKIYTKAKGAIKNMYNRIKPVIIIGIKVVYQAIRRMFLLMAVLAFYIVPFLNACIDTFMAQCIWYPALSVMVILSIRELLNKEEPDCKKTVVAYVEKWSSCVAIFIFVSIFVIRYYRITYVWLWVIFGVVAICAFLFFLSLLSYELKSRELMKEEKQKISINTVKSIILYWLFDLTYMGIFNDWFWVTIICGTLAVTLVFYNLALAFFNIVESLRIWLVLELLCGMVIAIYLIYIIPNEKLQSIIVAIVAAVFGGLFTLIGVAWTFKKGDIDRKEDERKKNIPYMKVVFGIKETSEACACIYNSVNLRNINELEQVDENLLYVITIQDCIIKNISESNLILRGMLFDDKSYDFTEPVILEKGEVCKIRTTGNVSIFVRNLESTLILITTDIMDNVYRIECKLNYVPEDKIITVTTEDCEYTCFKYKCVVGSVKLPVLVDGKK